MTKCHLVLLPLQFATRNLQSYHIIFDRPGWLALLAILPALWWFSYRSLSGLGPVRRWFAIGLRSGVLLLVIAALAELRFAQDSARLTVIYLLDQSESIPESQRRLMLDYVRDEVKKHRNKESQDRAGIIVFGQQAEIEIPPFDDSVEITQLETRVDGDRTNLAAALKMAQAVFPDDAAKRIVVISDGNENVGDALEQARMLAEMGVALDVIPVRYALRIDVATEKVTLPADVRLGQPFELRVVLNNTAPANSGEAGIVTGKLTIVREKGGAADKVIPDPDAKPEPVRLPPGKTVLTLREQIDSPGMYSYKATFTPDPNANLVPRDKNKTATSFTSVQGAGRILLIEDWEHRGEHEFLIQKLAANKLDVTVEPSDKTFDSLAKLQLYDCVILANVPRSSGFEAVDPQGKVAGENIRGLSDQQINMLVRNTQQMGAGLIMLGGDNSFGAGGWTDTELEAAMPVDFRIKAAKVEAVGALAMLMHASEMADGNHWQKVIAKEAVKVLGPLDYCGVIHYTGNDTWLWRDPANKMALARVGPMRASMLGRIDRMVPGDMPGFDNPLTMIDAEMAKIKDAKVKHVIVISDGDPPLSGQGTAALASLKNQGAKVTTVAIGAHGTIDTANMQQISSSTGGVHYTVNKASALPRIYQKEARRVARPLVYENRQGIETSVFTSHEILAGFDLKKPAPSITGYVLTHKKDNPLVEQILTAPGPIGDEMNPVLAAWTYGIGRTVAFTTDAGRRWASRWTEWENYEKFFLQMVNWAMRPTGDTGKFTVATDVRDGKVKVTVTALDKDDEFLNFLSLTGAVVDPAMESTNLKLQQTAPGRYVGEFDTPSAGSYFLSLNTGTDKEGRRQAPLIAGVNVPYSSEFLDREINDPLLKSLASLTPKDAPAGQIIGDLTDRRSLERLLDRDTFRHDLPHVNRSNDAWQWLLLSAACVFVGDVFIRRVLVNFAWVTAAAAAARNRLSGRPAAAKDEFIERLRSRKAEVQNEVEQQKAASRFDPAPRTEGEFDLWEELKGAAPPSPGSGPARPAAGGVSPDQAEPEDYTSRLLKAKRKARGEGET